MTIADRIRWNTLLSGYGLAVITVTVACVIFLLLAGILGQQSWFLLSCTAVVLSSWWGGLRPGLLATLLSALLGLILRPTSLPLINVASVQMVANLGLLLLAGVCLSWLGETLQAARQRSGEKARQETGTRKQEREMLDGVRDGFASLDANLDLAYANPVARRLLREGEILPNGNHRSAPGTSALTPLLEQQCARALAEQATVQMEQFDQPGDKWYQVSVSPLESGGVSLHFKDITDQKSAETALRNRTTELEQALAGQTTQLEAAGEELNSFAYSVSHDLRAPLRAVDGFSRILLEEYSAQLPSEASEYLQLIRDSTLRMGRLMDDLLTFSRLGRRQLTLQPVEPVHLVRQVLEELRTALEGRQVRVTVGDLPSCRADAAMLKLVFTNLLSNAFKFTRHRDVAHIEVGSRSDAAEPAIYFVRDDGVGFDMRYAGKLFGVFQRLHSVEEYEGTGAGLATVQRIVRRHGGRIWAEAEVEKGVTFFFTLGTVGPQ